MHFCLKYLIFIYFLCNFGLKKQKNTFFKVLIKL